MYIYNLLTMSWYWIGLVISLLLLIRAADAFIKGSEVLGSAIGMSSFLVGVTIVAIGTSLPELATSLIATLNGQNSFAVDNIMGSNISNILLVGGIIMILAKELNINLKITNILVFFLITVIFLIIVRDGYITQKEGCVLLILLMIYIIFSYLEGKKVLKNEEKNKTSFKLKDFFMIVFGGLLIILSSKYVIFSIENIAKQFHINISLMTIFVVTLGTSLPEIIVSISAIKKGDGAMAIGSIIGSSMLNILVVAGIPAIFTKLSVSGKAFGAIPFLFFATMGFVIISIIPTKKKRNIGYILVLIYFVFMFKSLFE